MTPAQPPDFEHPAKDLPFDTLDTLKREYESVKRANNYLRTGKRYLPNERTPRDEKWRLRALSLQKRLNITADDFADMLGVERSVVRSWATGRAAPTRIAPLAGRIRNRIVQLEKLAKIVTPGRAPTFSLENRVAVVEIG